MKKQTGKTTTLLRALPRAAILLAALFAPMIAMQTVQASSEAIIVDSSRGNSGAGFVIVAGLRRA